MHASEASGAPLGRRALVEATIAAAVFLHQNRPALAASLTLEDVTPQIAPAQPLSQAWASSHIRTCQTIAEEAIEIRSELGIAIFLWSLHRENAIITVFEQTTNSVVNIVDSTLQVTLATFPALSAPVFDELV